MTSTTTNMHELALAVRSELMQRGIHDRDVFDAIASASSVEEALDTLEAMASDAEMVAAKAATTQGWLGSVGTAAPTATAIHEAPVVGQEGGVYTVHFFREDNDRFDNSGYAGPWLTWTATDRSGTTVALGWLRWTGHAGGPAQHGNAGVMPSHQGKGIVEGALKAATKIATLV